MRKFTYKAAFYGWAGLIACVILAKIVSCANEQNHIVTDPGPDVVVRYPAPPDSFMIVPNDTIQKKED